MTSMTEAVPRNMPNIHVDQTPLLSDEVCAAPVVVASGSTEWWCKCGIKNMRCMTKIFSNRHIHAVLHDHATQTLLINGIVMLLFYKTIYADLPLGWTFWKNRHWTFASITWASLVCSPAIMTIAEGIKDPKKLLLRITLLDPLCVYVMMLVEYWELRGTDKRLLDEQIVQQGHIISRIDTLAGHLARSLKGETISSSILIFVQVVVRLFYLESFHEQRDEVQRAVTEAIFFSTLSLIINTLRFDIRHPILGQVAYKAYVQEWQAQGLGHFPIVVGGVEFASIVGAAQLLLCATVRLVAIFALCLVTALLHGAFSENPNSVEPFHRPSLAGPIYLAVFLLAIGCIASRKSDKPKDWFLAIINGALCFPAPLCMRLSVVSPAAAVSCTQYYICRVAHLGLGVLIGWYSLPPNHWLLIKYPHALSYAVATVASLVVLLLILYRLTQLTEISLRKKQRAALVGKLVRAITLSKKALPPPLTQFYKFFNNAYDIKLGRLMERGLDDERPTLDVGRPDNFAFRGTPLEIAEAISRYQGKITLRSVILEGALDDSDGADALGELWRKSPLLENLDCSNIGLTPATFAGMVAQVPTSSNLKILNIGGNDGVLRDAVGSDALGELWRKSPLLENLGCSNTGLAPACFARIVAQVPTSGNLKSLKISCNLWVLHDAVGWDALGELWRKSPLLENLACRHISLTPATFAGMVAQVPTSSNLKILDISINRVLNDAVGSDALVELWRKSPLLENLDCSVTGLTPATFAGMVAQVPTSSNLKILNIHSNDGVLSDAVGSDALVELWRKSPLLENLDCSNTGLTPATFSGMVAQVPTSSNLKILNIGSNDGVLNDAVGSDALVELWRKSPLLENLACSGTGLTPVYFARIVAQVPTSGNLKILKIYSNEGVLNDAMGSEALGELWRKSPLLEHLDCSDIGLTPATFAGMVAQVPTSSNLKMLNISSNDGVLNDAVGSDALGEFCRKSPLLENLGCSGIGLAPACFARIVAQVPASNRLKSFSVMRNHILFSVDDAKPVLDLTARVLSDCELAFDEYPDVVQIFTGALHDLTSIRLPGSMVTFVALVKKMPENSKLRSLFMCYELAGAVSFLAWGELWRKSPLLENLDCSDIGLTPATFAGMVAQVPTSSNLKILDISVNQGVLNDAVGSDALGELCRKSPLLENLDCSDTGLTPATFAGMVAQVPTSSNLKILNIGVNGHISGGVLNSAVGSDALGELWRKSPLLENLDCSGTGLTPASFAGVVAQVPTSSNLKILNIRRNEGVLKDAVGSDALGELWRKSPLLENLDCSDTGLTPSAFARIVALAPENNKLKKFKFFYTGVRDEPVGSKAFNELQRKSPLLNH